MSPKRPSQLLARLCVVAAFAITLVSCSKDDMVVAPDDVSSYADTVITYFKEISLGFEFGNASKVTRKWRDRVRIFIGGQPGDEILEELDSVIAEINALTLDGFLVSIAQDSANSNFYLYLGSGTAYGAIYPGIAHLVPSNWGLFNVLFNGMNEIYSAHMYVDIFRADLLAQRHLLREELTQSLGLARDSFRYSESIFQQDWTLTTAFTVLDRLLIQALYHPLMETGLDCDDVRPVLEEILREIL